MPAAVTEGAATQRSVLALPRSPRGLYAVTPEITDTATLVRKVEAALAGGAAAIQYRNKSASASQRTEQAQALVALCRRHGALCIINDDARLAVAVAADGVHLGADDGDLAAARTIVGPARCIGVSCYGEFARAQSAVAAGADHVAFGSMYASIIKPDAPRAERSLLTRARGLGVPVVAIGGIDADNAPLLIRAGADAIAVISAVFAFDDPAAITRAARALANCFTHTSSASR